MRKFPRRWAWPKLKQWALEKEETVPVDPHYAMSYEKDWNLRVSAFSTMFRIDAEETLKELRIAVEDGLEHPTEEFSAFSRSLGKYLFYWARRPQRGVLADFILDTYGAKSKSLQTILSKEAYEAILRAVRVLDDTPAKGKLRKFRQMVGEEPVRQGTNGRPCRAIAQDPCGAVVDIRPLSGQIVRRISQALGCCPAHGVNPRSTFRSRRISRSSRGGEGQASP